MGWLSHCPPPLPPPSHYLRPCSHNWLGGKSRQQEMPSTYLVRALIDSPLILVWTCQHSQCQIPEEITNVSCFTNQHVTLFPLKRAFLRFVQISCFATMIFMTNFWWMALFLKVLGGVGWWGGGGDCTPIHIQMLQFSFPQKTLSSEKNGSKPLKVNNFV